MLIGHASQDENKKISGGIAGDQTGKEVCKRQWYNKPWNAVLRCTDSTKAEQMARTCEMACDNSNIGYDQNQRNTLRTQAISCSYDLSKIKTPCECDCSSFMAVCAECAGIKIPYYGNNAPTTSTMTNAFASTGLFQVITDPKYTASSTYLKRGDVLVGKGHTVMVLGNEATESTKSYIIGKDYTTNTELYIRDNPSGNKKKYDCITLNAKQHSRYDSYGYAILYKDTKVTCKEVKEIDGNTWLKIPSGWICAIEKGKVYIE